MKITLIEDQLPELLPESRDPIRNKIWIIPVLDNPQLKARRKLTWAWSEALAERHVKHCSEVSKNPTVSMVEEPNSPIDLTLSWSSNVSPYDAEFQDNWRRLMAWCYMSKQDKGELHVTFVGREMPPSCKLYTREFSSKELYNNWTGIMGVQAGQDTGFRQSTKKSCTVNPSYIPDLLPMQGRSEGFHVSTGVKTLARELGTIPQDDSGLSTTWAQIGCAWEDVVIKYLQRTYPGRYVVLPELELDGIYGTSDLYDTWEDLIIEIKMAWVSCNQPWKPGQLKKGQKDKLFRYRSQSMSYCKMKDTRRAQVIVCHVVGDWRTLTPQYRVWEFEFSQNELDDNWRLIVMKRDEWVNNRKRKG